MISYFFSSQTHAISGIQIISLEEHGKEKKKKAPR
jgi:hypothetical protein